MTTLRRKHSPEFKVKAVVEAIRGQRTLNEIASEMGVHPLQISQWKKQALEALPGAFTGVRGKRNSSVEPASAELFEEIGRLKMELEWLKKRVGSAR